MAFLLLIALLSESGQTNIKVFNGQPFGDFPPSVYAVVAV